MRFETIFTQDYVLLIQVTLSERPGMHIRYPELKGATDYEVKPIIEISTKLLNLVKNSASSYELNPVAYRKLRVKALELNLPLLPDFRFLKNRFNEVDIDNLAKKIYPVDIYDEYTREDENEEKRSIWIDGFNSAKDLYNVGTYSLEDVKKVISVSQDMLINWDEKKFKPRYTEEAILNELELNRKPKYFIPDINISNSVSTKGSVKQEATIDIEIDERYNEVKGKWIF